jgi:hypothetical protein
MGNVANTSASTPREYQSQNRTILRRRATIGAMAATARVAAAAGTSGRDDQSWERRAVKRSVSATRFVVAPS